MLDKFFKALGVLDRITSTIATVFLFAIMMIVFCDVVMRYLFNSPFAWAYDLIAMYLMAGVFFLVLSDAYEASAHVNVDILQQRIGRRHGALPIERVDLESRLLVGLVGEIRAIGGAGGPVLGGRELDQLHTGGDGTAIAGKQIHGAAPPLVDPRLIGHQRDTLARDELDAIVQQDGNPRPNFPVTEAARHGAHLIAVLGNGCLIRPLPACREYQHGQRRQSPSPLHAISP